MRQVTAPDGKRWVVRRHWLARLPVWVGPRPRATTRRQRSPERKSTVLDALADLVWIGTDLPVSVLVGIAVIALALLAVPVLIFLVDAVLIGLVALIVLLARVAFRRPWLILAETPGPPPAVHRWQVSGWRTSAERIDHVATTIEATGTPPPA